ncbi:MAG TPA: plastocyanin/azurin family copper-binding protein [Solirubrobacteraceae bacterium]|nr:plastocyanin/azurin family copper-binding protein [Solirubrobacteraceae bacterium]
MFAAAPSKVPYYIAGGLLAAWAVLLAVWGISHAEFPGSPGRARLVMLTSFMLVVATLTTAVVTGGEAEEHAGGASAGPPATGRTLALAADPGGALRFDTTRAAVQSGRVTVELTNQSAVPHNVTIARDAKTLGATRTIADATDRLTLRLAPGDYVFFCSVPGHRQAGMEGTLTVK